MTVSISDEVLQSAQLNESELKTELALALFQQDRLALGQAAQLAERTQLSFQALLASRGIAIHYDFDQLEADLKRVAELPLP